MKRLASAPSAARLVGDPLDPARLACYDLKEDAGAAEELVLLQRLGLTRASVLVDIGAGTGQFALAAARPARAWSRSTCLQ